MTYEMLLDDLRSQLPGGPEGRLEGATADVLRLGHLPGRLKIYIAEFERLARQLEISEEGKVQNIFKSVPPIWQHCLIEAQSEGYKVVLTGVPGGTTGR